MLKQIIHFLKYNNFTIVILFVVFIIGSGVFAQTETGQEIIGQKQTNIQGIDNKLLLEANLDTLDMSFKIEKVEQDTDYYYVTYTLIDLVKQDSAWQYQLREKNRKVSKKIDQDLGIYLAQEFKEEYEARIKDLKAEQDKAKETGPEERVEVTEYSGLIGKTLGIADKIFPNYEPIKKQAIATPEFPADLLIPRNSEANTQVDNLQNVYNDYMKEKDPDNDQILGFLDNCPNQYNPDQIDTNSDGTGDACEVENIPTPIETSTSTDTAVTSEETTTPTEPENTSTITEETSNVETIPEIMDEPALPDTSTEIIEDYSDVQVVELEN